MKLSVSALALIACFGLGHAHAQTFDVTGTHTRHGAARGSISLSPAQDGFVKARLFLLADGARIDISGTVKRNGQVAEGILRAQVGAAGKIDPQRKRRVHFLSVRVDGRQCWGSVDSVGGRVEFQTAAPTAPASASHALAKKLQGQAQGLVHVSEITSSFQAFVLAGDAVVSAAAFRARLELPSSRPADVHPLPEFITGVVARPWVDPTPGTVVEVMRWGKLLGLMEAAGLRNLKVYRVGDAGAEWATAEKRMILLDHRIYVVGTDAQGRQVGLVTSAVEA